MMQSMTGFGKSTTEWNDKKIIVEIKSLNSKQLDVNMRISYLFREKELAMRSIIAEHLVRGKIDMSLYIETHDAATDKSINEAVVAAYYKQLQSVARTLGEPTDNLLEIIMNLPDVVSSAQAEIEIDEQLWELIQQSVEDACTRVLDFRAKEATALSADLHHNIDAILGLLQLLHPYEEARIHHIKDKISASLSDTIAPDKIDTNRFEQELLFYIEKLDINEEKVRLTQHCNYFKSTMKEDNCGRKLSFIAQEIGREINTIGSKSYDADMQKIVVQMKDYLEKIKEQTLNVL